MTLHLPPHQCLSVSLTLPLYPSPLLAESHKICGLDVQILLFSSQIASTFSSSVSLPLYSLTALLSACVHLCRCPSRLLFCPLLLLSIQLASLLSLPPSGALINHVNVVVLLCFDVTFLQTNACLCVYHIVMISRAV